MTQRLNFLLLCFLIIQVSCLIKPPEVLEPWEKALDFSTNTPYRNMHATSSELHLISDDEFVRLDQNGTLLSRSPISLPFKFFGRPILGDLAIARIVRKEAQGNPVLELRSTRNVDLFLDTDFTTLDDSINNPNLDNIFPEEDSRYSGAFNANSSQLLVPAINFSKNVHTFFLINLNYGIAGNGIESVEVEHVIDINEIPAANGVIDNIKFINGNYYVISLDGSYIIRPNGSYSRIFQGHFWDFFPAEDKIYATERSRALYSSSTNGENWILQSDSSNLQHVEIANNEIFTQQAIGFRFKSGTQDFNEPEEMVYNPDLPNDFAAYRNVSYHNGNYYMTVQKELWKADEIMIVEE